MVKTFHGKSALALLFSILIVAAPRASSASGSDSPLAEFVESGMDLWDVPGMAVTVVESEKVLFSQGFGVTTIRKGKPVDEHTLFANASTTKAMVAAGLLMLADEGKLTLDDVVTKHIPELHFNTPLLTEQVTIRDLLAHRTGLPSTDFWTFFLAQPLDEQIKRLAAVEPANPLRTGFIYQNTMFELAGLIIERVSGQRWDHFLEQRLWQPIGMNETFGSRGQIDKGLDHVMPHDLRDDKLQIVDWSLPADLADAAGSAWTSIHDMGLWAQFLLRGGTTAEGERLLSEESIEEMFHPQQLIPASSFYPTHELTQPNWLSYGLGWFQQDFQGRKIDFHTGSLSGLIAIIGLDRANDRAVVVLGNRDHAELRHAILWKTMDQDPDGQRRDWNQDIWSLYEDARDSGDQRWAKLDSERLSDSSPSLPLAAYTGQFTTPALGDITIVLEKGKMIFRTAKLDMPMSHWHLDTFVVEHKPWGLKEFATFQVGPDSKINRLSLFELDFSRQADPETK